MSDTERPKRPRGRVTTGDAGIDAQITNAPSSRATLPATDALDSDVPLKLSPDAAEGTRDRLTAFEWMEEGAQVRRRDDGVYERVMPLAGAEAAPPLSYDYYPDVEVLDRRLLDPTIASDVTIQFKDETTLRPGAKPLYYKRWIDTHIPSRLLTLTQRGGYKTAEWDMLADKNEIGDRHEGTDKTTDRVVRRGEKGRYVLVFMPYRNWEQIKRAQAELRTSRERTQMTRLAASQGAHTKGIGAQGAEHIDSMFTGTIRELPPQSLESFASSGVPKDLATGEGVTVLEE
jgi:hypothetical protein